MASSVTTSEQLPEGSAEFVNGALVELPPESRPNVTIANYLFLLLVNAGLPLALVTPGRCEIEVPVIKPGTPRTRYPDLVVLREEHLSLTQSRFTITRQMPPPQLVAEVVSPGDSNVQRDYADKREQYQALGIPEYWLIDPIQQVVIVLELKAAEYVEFGFFQGNDLVRSALFGAFGFTAKQLLTVGV